MQKITQKHKNSQVSMGEIEYWLPGITIEARDARQPIFIKLIVNKSSKAGNNSLLTGQNWKNSASIHQIAVRFYSGHLQPEMLICNFSALQCSAVFLKNKTEPLIFGFL